MKKDEILYELNDKPLGDEAGITGELFETDEPGYMYILLSANGSHYVGSTKYLKLRIKLHSDGIGAKHTIQHQPIQLVYFEKFNKIQDTFNR